MAVKYIHEDCLKNLHQCPGTYMKIVTSDVGSVGFDDMGKKYCFSMKKIESWKVSEKSDCRTLNKQRYCFSTFKMSNVISEEKYFGL